MAGQLAKGITLTFKTLASKLIDISPGHLKRAKVKTTHQASEKYEEGIPAAFRDVSAVTCTLQHLPTEDYQALYEAEDPDDITITYPTPSGLSNPRVKTNTGWISDYGEAYKLGDLMVIDLEFEVTGGWDDTPAS